MGVVEISQSVRSIMRIWDTKSLAFIFRAPSGNLDSGTCEAIVQKHGKLTPAWETTEQHVTRLERISYENARHPSTGRMVMRRLQLGQPDGKEETGKEIQEHAEKEKQAEMKKGRKEGRMHGERLASEPRTFPS